MPEILTESFCERCGTRYTFEAAAPATGKRLGKFKVLGKGLKNFVLDDDSSLDEAFAEARNEEDRVTTSQQLDAFHQAFNFCMSCRQYTCANCWNDAEGRCQSCAPLVGGDFMEATTTKLRGGKGKNGRPSKAQPSPSVDALAWPTTDLRRFDTPTPEPAKPREPVFDLAAQATPAPAETEEPAAEPGGEYVVPDSWPEIPSLAERLAAISGPVAPTVPEPAASAGPQVAPPAPVRQAPDDEADERAAAKAAETAAFLGRFRPGQSIDEALEAYETRRRAEESAAAPKPEPIAPEPEPEPIAAQPEPEPESAPPPALQPGSIRRAPGSIRRGRVPRTDDRVELPTWRINAPEATPDTRRIRPRPSRPAAPSGEPARPETPPQWPGQPATDSLAFLTNRTTGARDMDEVWAASARDVLAAPGSPTAPAGVQPCVSCGLSLSATARFCRRCGTRQSA